MASHNLSESEFYEWMNISLVRLESQLQTILNEFRSIRIARESVQTPTPPPPISATAPRVPPLASPTTSSPASLPPTSAFEPLPALTTAKYINLVQPSTIPPPPKLTPIASSTHPPSPNMYTPIPTPTLSPPIIKTPKRSVNDITFIYMLHRFSMPSNSLINPCWFKHISPTLVRPQLYKKATSNIFGSCGSGASKESHYSRYSFDGIYTIFRETMVNGRQEWRPPWLATTSPNATGRIEWRPPLSFMFKNTGFHLEDKVNSSGVDCYVPCLRVSCK